MRCRDGGKGRRDFSDSIAGRNLDEQLLNSYAGEGLFGGGLGILQSGGECIADSATDGAGGQRGIVVKGEQGIFAERSIDIEQGDAGGRDGQSGSTGFAGGTVDDSGFGEFGEDTADEGRIGVDATGHLLRGDEIVAAIGESGEDMYGDRETGVGSHDAVSSYQCAGPAGLQRLGVVASWKYGW